MNRKAELFFDAITLLPEDLVEEAQDYAFRKSPARWRKFASLAACLMLVASLGLLAALPKGCGGAAPAPECSNSSGPPSGECAPQAPADTPADTEAAFQFTAIVLEVRERGIVVTPAGYDSEYEIEVSTAGLDVPELETGDWVSITYDGMIQETYPARIAGASAVEKLEK